MSVNYGAGTQYPTVNLAVNKSRIKLYGSTTVSPTYYLNKGQEFQIELFNPTTDVVLARISLNGKLISDGGLIVKPGERVFLDRFLDENKKFLFDTYQVDNIEAVKQAIKDNGDLEVAFHKEVTKQKPNLWYGSTSTNWDSSGTYTGNPFVTTSSGNVTFTTTNNTGSVTLDGLNTNTTNTFINSATGDYSLTYNSANLSKDFNMPIRSAEPKKGVRKRISKTSNKIETGRVEKGSTSKQKIETVDMEFETYAFHTVSYKMLPSSQKNITSEELVEKYCVNCGKKNKPNNKFCPNCGTKR